MAMRCSLLGHDFGTPEVEREREERGSEVVVTVTEYEECTRCGETNVISENTEVTSLGSASAPTDESDVPPTDAADEPADAPLETDASTEVADDELPDDPAEANSAEDGPDADEESDHPAVDEPPEDEPITDDGEILDEDDSSPDRDREHGEWPDSEDVGPPVGAENEPATWPEDGPDVDDPDVDDDAEVLEADAAAEEPPAAAATEPEGDAAPETESGSGIASAKAAPVPGEGARSEGVRTEFFCPRCDFVAPGDRGSLRSGDICPDCRKGYISERER